MSGSLNTNFDGMGPAGQEPGKSVQPLAAMTPPEPATPAPTTEYYYCPVPNASMHRPDGFRLPFLHRIHATGLLPSQKYLDAEIAGGNPYIRKATEEEISTYKMLTNPRETLTQQITAEVEMTLRQRIEAEIKEKLAKQGIDPDFIKIQTADTRNEVAAKLASGIRSDGVSIIPENIDFSPNAQAQRAIVGSDKIAGVAASGSAPATTIGSKG